MNATLRVCGSNDAMSYGVLQRLIASVSGAAADFAARHWHSGAQRAILRLLLTPAHPAFPGFPRLSQNLRPSDTIVFGGTVRPRFLSRALCDIYLVRQHLMPTHLSSLLLRKPLWKQQQLTMWRVLVQPKCCSAVEANCHGRADLHLLRSIPLHAGQWK